MSKIQQAIRDQIETLIKNPQTTSKSELSLRAQDLYQIFYSQFTPEAIQLIGNRTSSMIHQYNKQLKWGSEYNYKLSKLLGKLKLKNHDVFDTSTYVREYAKVECFGLTCTSDKVAEAALSMVAMINHFAANAYGLATLEPLMLISLADGRFCVVSYIAIDQQHYSLVESTCRNFMFQEGGLPPEFI